MSIISMVLVVVVAFLAGIWKGSWMNSNSTNR